MRFSMGGWVLKSACEVDLAERVDDEEVGDGRVDLHRPHAGVVLQLLEGAGQGEGRVGDVGAGFVGAVLALAGDGHADDGGRHGGEDDRGEYGEDAEHAAAAVAVTAAEATEDEAPLEHRGEERDGAGDGGDDGVDQDVLVADVAELVAEDGGAAHGRPGCA